MLFTTSCMRSHGFWMLLILVICTFSFAYSQKEGGPFRSFQSFQPAAYSLSDTIPGKEQEEDTLGNRSVLNKELNSRFIEEALKNIEYNLNRLEEELRNKDWSSAGATYKKAIDNIDWDQIGQNAQLALADLNKRINIENEIHLDRLKMQLNNMKVMTDQKLKQLQFNIDHNLQLNLQHASRSLQGAKMSLQQLKAFTTDLEKDGLIEKDKPGSVEIKNGDLYINEVKQSKRITKKYRKKYKAYFEEKDGFKLQLNGVVQHKDRGGPI